MKNLATALLREWLYCLPKTIVRVAVVVLLAWLLPLFVAGEQICDRVAAGEPWEQIHESAETDHGVSWGTARALAENCGSGLG
jgi:hypothetical protein